MRYGSLFSGAGGLDLAIEEVFGAECAWQCECDAAASKVLAAHWPDVPNLHDVTKVDWATVEPVDIMCGGYPCQPFSAAGQRKGTDDDRHLWPYFAEAIRRVRPRYVVLENVAGHRSMGFDSVLGDLAALGYDAQWCSIRASDVGAPHRRERLFVLATDTTRIGRGTRWTESAGFEGRPDVAVSSDADVALLPTPCAKQSGNTPEDHLRKKPGRKVVTDLAILVENGLIATGGELLPTPVSRDHKGANQRSDTTCLHGALLLLQTPSAADGDGSRKARGGIRGDEPLLPGQAVEMSTRWGKYAPAIHRWESVTRPAPSPTEPNTKGDPRLAAAFSEWLMGWSAGWVTAVEGLSRNDQLRIIGNGVVTLQAVAALRWLLTVSEVAA